MILYVFVMHIFLGSNYIMLAGYTFIAVCNNKDGIFMFQPTAVLIGFVKELTALDDYMCIIYNNR